jgi:hypothetical protein
MSQFRSSALTFVLTVSCAMLLLGCEKEEMPDIVMVWKGVEDDQALYRTYLINRLPDRGPYWEPQELIPDAGSSHGPAATAFAPTVQLDDPPWSAQTRVFSAWKGVDGDEQLYWWNDVHGAHERDGRARLPFFSSHGPALAAQPFQYVYLAWKGAGKDQGIYWAYNNLLHTDDSAGGWQGQGRVPNVGTSEKPALAYRYPLLHMAWKGIAGDSGIYVSANSGDTSWQPQHRVPDVGTSRGPALAFFNGVLHLVWKGVGDDQGIYHASSSDNGNTWTPQENITGVGTSDSPALCATKTRLYMAWKGVDGDSGLYWTWSFTGGNWAAPLKVPGVGSSHGPSLAVDDTGIPRQ